MENERGGRKMSAPSTSSLSVITVTRVIDVKYGCFTFFGNIVIPLDSSCQSKASHS